jgi:hypothetical protein
MGYRSVFKEKHFKDEKISNGIRILQKLVGEPAFLEADGKPL